MTAVGVGGAVSGGWKCGWGRCWGMGMPFGESQCSEEGEGGSPPPPLKRFPAPGRELTPCLEHTLLAAGVSLVLGTIGVSQESLKQIASILEVLKQHIPDHLLKVLTRDSSRHFSLMSATLPRSTSYSAAELWPDTPTPRSHRRSGCSSGPRTPRDSSSPGTWGHKQSFRRKPLAYPFGASGLAARTGSLADDAGGSGPGDEGPWQTKKCTYLHVKFLLEGLPEADWGATIGLVAQRLLAIGKAFNGDVYYVTLDTLVFLWGFPKSQSDSPLSATKAALEMLGVKVCV